MNVSNPVLEALAFLVGEWETTGTHPYMPGAELHGRSKFEWIEGRAFLIMHGEIDDSRFPKGVAIFASDDGADEIYMLYFDDRGVSRKYDVVVECAGMSWSRDDKEFSQRFTLTTRDDGAEMVSKGEMRRNGGEWEGDLSLIYKRIVQ